MHAFGKQNKMQPQKQNNEKLKYENVTHLIFLNVRVHLKNVLSHFQSLSRKSYLVLQHGHNLQISRKRRVADSL